jgi:hypothetical protein
VTDTLKYLILREKLSRSGSLGDDPEPVMEPSTDRARDPAAEPMTGK